MTKNRFKEFTHTIAALTKLTWRNSLSRRERKQPHLFCLALRRLWWTTIHLLERASVAAVSWSSENKAAVDTCREGLTDRSRLQGTDELLGTNRAVPLSDCCGAFPLCLKCDTVSLTTPSYHCRKTFCHSDKCADTLGLDVTWIYLMANVA